MQDFWKVAFSFEIPWETDLGIDVAEDSTGEVEEIYDFEEEEVALEYHPLDPDQSMEIWWFEL